jgi:hypothetical protein
LAGASFLLCVTATFFWIRSTCRYDSICVPIGWRHELWGESAFSRFQITWLSVGREPMGPLWDVGTLGEPGAAFFAWEMKRDDGSWRWVMFRWQRPMTSGNRETLLIAPWPALAGVFAVAPAFWIVRHWRRRRSGSRGFTLLPSDHR